MVTPEHIDTQKHPHTGTLTRTHRPTNLHEPPEVDVICFVYFSLSAVFFLLCVTSEVCCPHLAPLLIAQQHTLRGEFTISLACPGFDRSPNCYAIPSRIVSSPRCRVPQRTEHGRGRVRINVIGKSNLRMGAHIFCYTDAVRLPLRIGDGFADTSCRIYVFSDSELLCISVV